MRENQVKPSNLVGIHETTAYINPLTGNFVSTYEMASEFINSSSVPRAISEIDEE